MIAFVLRRCCHHRYFCRHHRQHADSRVQLKCNLCMWKYSVVCWIADSYLYTKRQTPLPLSMSMWQHVLYALIDTLLTSVGFMVTHPDASTCTTCCHTHTCTHTVVSLYPLSELCVLAAYCCFATGSVKMPLWCAVA